MIKNHAKGLSYAEAWRRINSATAGGFYFEVVTICESIISDRLLSYVLGVKPATKLKVSSGFAEVIREWRALAGGTLPKFRSGDLGAAVDNWRADRNTIVHGLVKSSPGTPPLELMSFIQLAERAAIDGAELAKAVTKWHRQRLAEYKKTIKKLT